MDPAGFLQGRTRETTIRRDAEGTWYHDGQPLEHDNLCRSFDQWVERADDGRYCLKNDINWAYITLEGAPFFVRSVGVAEDGLVTLRLSDASEQPLAGETLRLGPDGALYCDVRGGTMTARFERHAMTQREAVIAEDDDGIYLALGGARVRPPELADPRPPTQERESDE